VEQTGKTIIAYKLIMHILRLIPFYAIAIVFFSCGTDNYKGTPINFKSRVKIDKPNLITDKKQINSIIKKMIVEKVNPFDLNVYDENTVIFVDTLIYSPDQTRLVAFIVDRNNTEKLVKKENNERYYYNATYLFGKKDKTGNIGIFDYCHFGLVNFYSYKEIREALYNYCFYRLLGESTQENIHYNVDDVRFWKSKDFERVIKNSKETMLP
jgi:hypothetical protein